MDGIRDRRGAGAEAERPGDEDSQGHASGRGRPFKDGKVINPEPMNINEAIEAMKIIAPCASEILQVESGLEIMKLLINHYAGDEAVQLGQLAALMFHEDLETMSETLKDATGAEFTSVLAAGLAVNPVYQLVEGAYLFQFAKFEELNDA